MAWKHSALVLENKKLKQQNDRLLSMLKIDDDIDFYTEDWLNEMFPDEEEE